MRNRFNTKPSPKSLLRGLFLWGVPFIAFAFASGGLSVALEYGSGTYGSCTYGTCGISLTSEGTVSLTAVPTTGGVNSTVKEDLTVGTDASTGYTLTFLDTDTDTTLANGANTLAATSGTQASPVTLAMNTWGYRVDGLAGFGAGPTSAQSSSASALYTFAGVPASNVAAHTLKTTAAAANPAEVTSIWYGVRIDTTKLAGTYTDTVTYTAVTND